MVRSIRGKINLLLTIAMLVSLFASIGGIAKIAAAADSTVTVTLKSSATASKKEKNKTVTSTAAFVTVSNSSLYANSSTSSGSAQQFDLKIWSDGTVSFLSKSGTNQYVTVSSSGTVSMTTISNGSMTSAEKFAMIPSDNDYTFKSLKSNKFLSASTTYDDNFRLAADQSSNTGTAQLFTLKVVSSTNPTSTQSEIRILEITDSGESDLSSLFASYTSPKITVETLRMKQFVALRDDLDGKYDAIYIGKGSYNATLVGTDQNHNTTDLMNDITDLKMNEIKADYIERGLPVIVYSQGANSSTSGSGAYFQNTAGKLKTAFKAYVGSDSTPSASTSYVPVSSTDNVIFVGDLNLLTAKTFLDKTDLFAYAAARPRLTISSKPTDYTANTNYLYKAGDTMDFTFSVGNISDISKRSLTAKLYIGIDYVLTFGAEQLVTAQPVAQLAGNTLSFRLPKGYSGVHYWKLEIEDTASGLKDAQFGVIRFRDEITKINVLQILPGTGSGQDASSLTKSGNMNQSYLKSNDYEITITTTNIAAFNSTGYKQLNGYYDMLIFGFADVYNELTAIEANAAKAVQDYIATGQSVMFTHDTVYRATSNWVSYFQQATGQTGKNTNMGLNAKEPSTTTKKVNEGLLTRFPFNISNSTPQVNTTHDQYYTLNLEDRKLIPWYNITGGTRDVDDSWNHYYTYSYGNVTYSGTGHTNTGFPAWEQQLFVNTMYRAFIGSNHAPTLNVESPTDYAATNRIIPSYSDVLVSYTAEDYDLIDRNLYTSVAFKYKATGASAWTTKVVKPETLGTTGSIITDSYANPLPNGGDLEVTITAKDLSGAVVTKVITTKVVKVTANIDISRTLSSNVVSNQVDKDTAFTMTYSITPKSIAYQNGIDENDLVVKDIAFAETFPANLEVNLSDVSSLLLNPKLTGSLSTGYTLTGTLANIPFRKDGSLFKADPVSFTVKATPKQNGNYLLDKSSLDFKDFYVSGLTVQTDIDRTLQFPSFAIQAVTKLASLSLSDTIIALNDESKLIPVYTPDDATNKTLTWASADSKIVSVSSSGVIKGLAEGKTQITATATDGSGLIAVANVTVIAPGLNIVGPTTVNVNDTINLEAVLKTVGENVSTVSWALGTGQSGKAELAAAAGSLKSDLTGLNVGTVDVTVTITTDKTKTYTKTVSISVIQPIQLTLPSEIRIGKGTALQRDLWATALIVAPTNLASGIQSYTTWSSSQSAVATIGSANGVATGVAAGSTTITASYQKNAKSDPVTASTRLIVVELSGPAHVTIAKGKSAGLKSKLTVAPNDVSYDVLNNLKWSTDNACGCIAVDTSGNVTTTGSGTATVTVSYQQTITRPDGKTETVTIATKTIEIAVIDLGAPSTATIIQGKPTDLAELLNIAPDSVAPTVKESLAWTDNTADNTISVTGGGIATGSKPGTETITVTYTPSDGSDPITASVAIRVVPSLGSNSTMTVRYGKKGIDLAGLLPSELTADDLSHIYWSVSSTGSDRVRAASAKGTYDTAGTGEAQIVASYKDSSTGPALTSRTFTIKIVDLVLPTSLTLTIGDPAYNLLLTSNAVSLAIYPTSGTLYTTIKNNLKWSIVSSANAATVNSGLVTAKNAGSAVITVTYTPTDGDPITASINVLVKKANTTTPGKNRY
ncbi:DUF5057 domain-containing protein [Cohnella fermenti]|uniref:DUF5057 domain-containing protein n=1 Tax=Cohnella fermenti TaxID=2565925 RepID=A0A4S4BPW1_9BACL|nr:DUF5057 domain-containing protein [Cohnella fermenti]THF76945.1 DUF5057 domain-containing protein [Cohnella fermenti]